MHWRLWAQYGKPCESNRLVSVHSGLRIDLNLRIDLAPLDSFSDQGTQKEERNRLERMSANYRRSALSGLRKVNVDKLEDDEEEGEVPGIAWEMMLVTGISLMATDVSLII